MRKSEIERLLLNAVAEALGQPVPKQKRQKSARVAHKRIATRYRQAGEHHAHL